MNEEAIQSILDEWTKWQYQDLGYATMSTYEIERLVKE